MNITTKYAIGDKVFRIFRDHIQSCIACTVCGDTKQVEIKGTMFKCPNCERGTSNWHDRWFVHNEPTTIGKVAVEVNLKKLHNCNYFDEDEIIGDEGVTKETYMLSATGIGSGTIWNHDLLFLTLDEAKAECEKRNDKIIAEEKERPL